jgi:hypothetical protein
MLPSLLQAENFFDSIGVIITGQPFGALYVGLKM